MRYTLIALIVVLFMLAGCGQEDKAITNNTKPAQVLSLNPSPMEPEMVGELHNQGLNYVLDHMIATLPPQPTSEDVMDRLYEGTAGFLEENGLDVPQATILTAIDVAPYLKPGFDATVNLHQAVELLNGQPRVYTLLLQLETLVNTTTSVRALGAEISKWEQRVLETAGLEDPELLFLLSVGEVAAHSAAYWEAEYSRWETKLGVYPTDYPWGDLGKTDLAGAIVGGITGGGVLIGGLGASLGFAIVVFLNTLF